MLNAGCPSPARPARPSPQAAKALEICLRTVTPKIMTWGQYAEAACNIFEKNVLGRSVDSYVPDYTKCVDHFALHAGEAARRGTACPPLHPQCK